MGIVVLDNRRLSILVEVLASQVTPAKIKRTHNAIANKQPRPKQAFLFDAQWRQIRQYFITILFSTLLWSSRWVITSEFKRAVLNQTRGSLANPRRRNEGSGVSVDTHVFVILREIPNGGPHNLLTITFSASHENSIVRYFATCSPVNLLLLTSAKWFFVF